MKIVLNTRSAELINSLNRGLKTLGREDIEILSTRTEKGLFDLISDYDVKGFLIETPSAYSQKSLDFIKQKHQYTPVIVFGSMESIHKVSGGDIYMPYYDGDDTDTFFLKCVITNIDNYLTTFDTLRKLTTKIQEVIEFGPCKYDPTRRTLSYHDVQVKKLSAKEGGILEVLAANFGSVVKKDVILEKVWRKSDYFSGRSMDVYITHLRKLFRENNIDLEVKNISGVGLILE